MKATGIVRRSDALGRIVIPKELRRVMNIKDGDPIEIFTTEDAIVLKKYERAQSVRDKLDALIDKVVEEYGIIDCKPMVDKLREFAMMVEDGDGNA